MLEQCYDLEFEEECYSIHQISATKLNLVYWLLTLPFIDNPELLPHWTGFNTLLSKSNNSAVNLSRIGYLPIIEGPPTEYTVFTKSLDIGARLNLEYVVIVFDEAIYGKGQQIRWKNEIFMAKTILRLGDFHAVMSFCGAISRIFQDAGLRVCKLLIIIKNTYIYNVVAFSLGYTCRIWHRGAKYCKWSYEWKML